MDRAIIFISLQRHRSIWQDFAIWSKFKASMLLYYVVLKSLSLEWYSREVRVNAFALVRLCMADAAFKQRSISKTLFVNISITSFTFATT